MKLKPRSSPSLSSQSHTCLDVREDHASERDERARLPLDLDPDTFGLDLDPDTFG